MCRMWCTRVTTGTTTCTKCGVYKALLVQDTRYIYCTTISVQNVVYTGLCWYNYVYTMWRIQGPAGTTTCTQCGVYRAVLVQLRVQNVVYTRPCWYNYVYTMLCIQGCAGTTTCTKCGVYRAVLVQLRVQDGATVLSEAWTNVGYIVKEFVCIVDGNKTAHFNLFQIYIIPHVGTQYNICPINRIHTFSNSSVLYNNYNAIHVFII